MRFDNITIVPCKCGGYGGKPCKQVFIEGIDMRADGRFERPVAEHIAAKLSGKPTPAVVARQFSELLREQLGPQVMSEIVRLNREEKDANICHTHDYLDANMVMDDAVSHFGIHWDLDDGMPQEVADLWNAAWDLAKKADFDPEAVQS